MDSNTITALSSLLLVLVGYAQVSILKSQRRQSRLDFMQEYHRLWTESKREWGAIIYIGREEDEYYQVVDKRTLYEFKELKKTASYCAPSIWALDASRVIFTILSDACIRTLKGQLEIQDIYPIFGTELLRHSRPLRILLDVDYINNFSESGERHLQIRREIQDWLIYHDGIRRRCLILIDLLWAEASRLEDLPPDDLKSAAEAKIKSGKSKKTNVLTECIRMNGFMEIFQGIKLSRFLRHSEYRKSLSCVGIKKKRLQKLEEDWKARILRNFR